MHTRQLLHDKALTHWLYYYLTLPALETYLVGRGWQAQHHPVTATSGRRFVAPVPDNDGQLLETFVIGPQVELPRQFRYTVELAAAIEDREPLAVLRDILAASQPALLAQLDALLTAHRSEYLQ
ncbi:MAG TPA: hypothetical protein PKH77_00450 [Anaerolineae bacterium]|nr:hypothetical protein [Anaerolineae bacterium]